MKEPKEDERRERKAIKIIYRTLRSITYIEIKKSFYLFFVPFYLFGEEII